MPIDPKVPITFKVSPESSISGTIINQPHQVVGIITITGITGIGQVLAFVSDYPDTKLTNNIALIIKPSSFKISPGETINLNIVADGLAYDLKLGTVARSAIGFSTIPSPAGSTKLNKAGATTGITGPPIKINVTVKADSLKPLVPIKIPAPKLAKPAPIIAAPAVRTGDTAYQIEVTAQYLKFCGRSPEPAGLLVWQNSGLHGQDLADAIIEAILGQPDTSTDKQYYVKTFGYNTNQIAAPTPSPPYVLRFASDTTGSVYINGKRIVSHNIKTNGKKTVTATFTLPITTITPISPPFFMTARKFSSTPQEYYLPGSIATYNEGLTAKTNRWDNQSTFYMDNVAGLGAVLMHGTAPETTYTFTMPLPTHTRVRYRLYWHFVDSLDNELSTITIDGKLYASFRKQGSWNGRTFLGKPPTYETNLFAEASWYPTKYSYSPWAVATNNWQSSQLVNGFIYFDTGWIDHTASEFKVAHYFGYDQPTTDEAMYISNVRLDVMGPNNKWMPYGVWIAPAPTTASATTNWLPANIPVEVQYQIRVAKGGAGCVAHFVVDNSLTQITDTISQAVVNVKNVVYEKIPGTIINAIKVGGTKGIGYAYEASSKALQLASVAGSIYTIEAWVYRTGAGGMIINKDSEYEVHVNTDGKIWVAFDWGVGTDVDLPGGGWIYTDVIVQLNVETHIAVVVNNTNLKIYKNGALGFTTTLDRQALPSDNPVYIGNRPGEGAQFHGYIGDVRIWNSARTQNEISSDLQTAATQGPVTAIPSITAGEPQTIDIKIQAVNTDGNAAGFGASITDYQGNMIWNTNNFDSICKQPALANDPLQYALIDKGLPAASTYYPLNFIVKPSTIIKEVINWKDQVVANVSIIGGVGNGTVTTSSVSDTKFGKLTNLVVSPSTVTLRAGEIANVSVVADLTSLTPGAYSGVVDFFTTGMAPFSVFVYAKVNARPTATYTITPDKTSAPEGDILTFNVTTTSVKDGTTIYWKNTGTRPADGFTDNTNSGSTTVINGQATIIRSIAPDFKTTGTNTVIITLSDTPL
jgi:hypothetical protein